MVSTSLTVKHAAGMEAILSESFWAAPSSACRDSLVGLVVKASASRAEDSKFDSRLRREDFCPGRVMLVI